MKMITSKNLMQLFLVMIIAFGCETSEQDEFDSLNSGLNPAIGEASKDEDSEDDEDDEPVYIVYNGTTVKFNFEQCKKKGNSYDCENLSQVASQVSQAVRGTIRPRRPKECPQIGVEKPLLVGDKRQSFGSTCMSKVCDGLFGTVCFPEVTSFKLAIHSVIPSAIEARIILNGEIIEIINGEEQGTISYDEENSLATLNFETPLFELYEQEVIVEVLTIVELEGELMETNLKVQL